MPSFSEYLAQGQGWLFFPIAVFLGALHGLEPGHSKTVMTAYIVAIRGTVWQAFLLGVSATISHTAVIWILAGVGFYYSAQINVEQLEPYFQVATGMIIILLASWMIFRIRRAEVQHAQHHDHGAEYADDHERAHALEIQKQISGQRVTTWQIILFGLTGGLLPCPSAFAVLLLCLQLQKVTLGFAMVLAFSIGLALTLVTVGMVAAFSVRHAAKRFKGFENIAGKIPYASSIVLIVIGLIVGLEGMRHLLILK